MTISILWFKNEKIIKEKVEKIPGKKRNRNFRSFSVRGFNNKKHLKKSLNFSLYLIIFFTKDLNKKNVFNCVKISKCQVINFGPVAQSVRAQSL